MSWSLGLGVGAIVAFWTWVRDSPPAHIENWRTGRDAERRTAKALEPLVAAGWSVVHDVAAPYGNRDHVLVGPAGVFLVDTKHLHGVATVQGDVVRLERPDIGRGAYRDSRVAKGLRADAARLSDELRRLTGAPVWVNAVVLFWNDFPAAVVAGERVAFVAGAGAAAWFERQPKRLSPERVKQLGAAVTALPAAV